MRDFVLAGGIVVAMALLYLWGSIDGQRYASQVCTSTITKSDRRVGA